MKNTHKYVVGFVAGLSCVGILGYVHADYLGDSFQKIGDEFHLLGEKIVNETIVSEKIKDGEVKTSDIAADAINSSKIATGAVDTSDLATDAVDASKIAAGAVGSTEIATNSIDSSKIVDGAVDTSDLATDAVDASKIAAGAVGSTEIAIDAVGSSKISAGAVDNSKIAADAIDSSKILNGSIDSTDIKDGSISSADFATGAIGADKIATGSISGTKILDNSIDANDLADNSVGNNVLDNLDSFTVSGLSNLGTSQFTGNVGIGGAPTGSDDLTVYGDSEFQGNIDVNNSIFVTGDVNSANLDVTGNSNLGGNVTVGGNLQLDGTIAFTDPSNIPWANVKSNLPFNKLGGGSYIKPSLEGSFEGQVSPFHSRTYLYYENDGSLVALRGGYDGRNYGLYYAYSKTGDYADLKITSMKYVPAFLEGTDEVPVWIIGGNESSITFITRDSENKYNYYIVKHNSLDPKTHTLENVININSIITDHIGNSGWLNSLLYNWACELVIENDHIICSNGDVSQNLFYFDATDKESITKIPLLNTVKGIEQNNFFNMNDTDYVTQTGTTTGVYFWGDHTQTSNVHYHLDGDTLYVFTIRNSWNGPDERRRQIGINVTYKIDLTSNSVTYDDPLPYQYDFDNFDNNSKPLGLTTRFHNTKAYFFKNKKEVLLSHKTGDNVDKFNVHKYATFDNFLYFFRGFYGSIGGNLYSNPLNVKKTDDSDAFIGRKAYPIFDASKLGKTLYFTKFMTPEQLTTYSFSHDFNDGAQWNWLKITLPDYLTGATDFAGGVYLKEPTKVESLSGWGKAKIQTTTVTLSGAINGYSHDKTTGEITKWDGENIVPYLTLPSGYNTTIESDIESDASYSGATNYSYYIGVINDSQLMVNYGFRYPIDESTGNARHLMKTNVYNYSTGSITPTGTFRKELIDVSTPTLTSINSSYYTDIASFVTSSGDTYVSFHSPLRYHLGGNLTYIMHMHLDSAGNLVLDEEGKEKLSEHGRQSSWYQGTIGIHPYYGVYHTTNFLNSKTRNRLYYQNNVDISDLETRIIQSYEDFIAKGERSYFYDLTVRQAEGFIVYNGEIELFVDGVYTSLSTSSYDLTDPTYGLTSSGVLDVLENENIYVSIDKSDIIAPKLKFSFVDEGNTVAIIRTNTYGIESIIVIDGLNITSNETVMKTVFVKNFIKIIGEDGKVYKVYVDSTGSLKTTLFVE